MSDADAITNLIETYRQRWNARDFSGMAALFTEPSGMMSPDGLRSTSDRADVAAGLAARFADTDADGFDHTEIERVDVEICSSSLAIAHLVNLRRLRADGTVQSAFDSFYLCSKLDTEWRLTLGAACDLGWRDEKMM